MFGIAEERFCHLCGHRITHHYIQYTSGLVVCPSCDQTAPRCARCRVPVARNGSSVSPRGALLCGPCSRDVSYCDACNEPILDVWYSFEELIPTPTPRRFCSTCVNNRPRCDLCHAPTGATAITLTDGQYRCRLCATDLVIGEAAIRLVYTDAIEQLTALVGVPLRRTPPLEVVSRRRMGATRRQYMREITQTSGHVPAVSAHGIQMDPGSGASRHVLGFFVRTQSKPVIYVEAGLTRGLLLGTLAHELGHAWQAEALGPAAASLEPVVSEGFAEWVAYHTLLSRSLRTLASRARDRDDVYGRGLNRFLEIERARGRDAVLQIARAGRF